MTHKRTSATRQAPGQVRDNRLNLDDQTTREMVRLLNTDLASMWTLYHQYHKHHWIVEGAQFFELHLLLEAHYTELHDQFDVIAERINAIGGLPVTNPAEIQEQSYVQHEPPGMFDLREMLEHDVQAEGTIARQLREHIQAANQLGDYGSENILKEILQAGEKRAAFLQKHLQPESLTRRIPAQ